ncbi:pentapeptide repeat-containing protein [Nonomuraea sp. NPDC003214]
MSRSPRVLPRGIIAAAAVIVAVVAVRARRGAPTETPAPASDTPETTASATPQDTPAHPAPRGRRLRRLLTLLLTVVMIGACSAAALLLSGPDWTRWVLAGLALAGGASLIIAFLIGPAARRLAGETTPLTAAERRQLTPNERVEAVNAARHTLIQTATGLVVIGGVVFTAQGLWYTAKSLETSRDAQMTAEQGQITDRYTKAVEQLGSPTEGVRLGGIYALQRLAADSSTDRDTIRNVLAAYVRDHDLCTSHDSRSKLPEQCTATSLRALEMMPLARPDSDVLAALTIAPSLAPRTVERVTVSTAIGRAVQARTTEGRADFSHARFPRTNLSAAYLQYAYLNEADLRLTNLGEANLRGAYLGRATLTGADLRFADLTGAYLAGANLRNADLQGADLWHANLRGADLRGANLVKVQGMTEREIRAVAIVDAGTRFQGRSWSSHAMK